MDPAKRYIREVLGVSSLMLPLEALDFESSKSQPPVQGSDLPKFKIEGDEFSPVAVLVSQFPSAEGKALLQKILKAVGVETLLLVQSAQWREAHWRELARTVGAKKAISFASGQGQSKVFNGVEILFTGSLESMLSGSPEEIQNSKRAVWNHLKSFMA